ncbi:MAG: PDZ domain-containing protein [Planctomycetes bacterium]|nr:PDZ domain-containing protein [Planctomycetota bacterium]
MANPKGKTAKLLKDYVCILIDDLTGVDIGLFEFDPDSTLYCFILNADEQIYLRYGGRDDSSAEKYFNEDSLEEALEKGLALHKQYGASELEKTERPKPFFPRDYPEIAKDEIAKKKCVHCHHLGQARTILLQGQGKLDKMKDLWVYPAVERLGISLDVKTGLVVDDADGAAKDAGLKKKDVITKLEGHPVHTFGDLQYLLDKHPAASETLKLTMLRKDEQVEIEIKLDKWWRVTDIARRAGTHALEPFPEFWGKPLDKGDKRKLGIDENQFGLEVTKFWVKTNAQSAGLQPGDVVYEVDGTTDCEYTGNPVVWIRLNRKPGDSVTVKALRNGKKLEFSFKLKARPW